LGKAFQPIVRKKISLIGIDPNNYRVSPITGKVYFLV
jgi:hypothetical protein